MDLDSVEFTESGWKMSRSSNDLRDKAIVDGFGAVEGYLEMLESRGFREIAVEMLDEKTFVVSWLSPSDSGPSAKVE